MSTVRKMWKTVVAMILACIALPTVCHSAIVQLPSCLVPPEQADNNPLIAWVEVKIDSHGNFYAPWVSDDQLDGAGNLWCACVDAPLGSGRYWLVGRGLLHHCRTRTKDLCEGEANHCSGAKRFPRRRRSHIRWCEQTVANTSDQQLYFLSSVGADTDFVLRGFVGVAGLQRRMSFGCRVSATTSCLCIASLGLLEQVRRPIFTADEVEVANLRSMAVAGGKSLATTASYSWRQRQLLQAMVVWTCSSADYAPVRRLCTCRPKARCAGKVPVCCR